MTIQLLDIPKIRALNDAFRASLTAEHHAFIATYRVRKRGDAFVADALAAIMTYDFTPQNHPVGTHDFGEFELRGEPLVWTIDYVDLQPALGWPDPGDATRTRRKLTVMFADEYY